MEDIVQTDTNKWAILPEWVSAPSIDGQLNETLWDNAAVLNGFTTTFYEKPAAYEIGYKAAYGNGQLYIAGRMAEEEADTLAFVEIVLQPADDAPDMHYVARVPFPPSGPNDPVITTYWNTVELSDNSSRRNVTGSVYGMGSGDGFVTVETSIPLAELVPDGVEPGEEWGINILHVHRLYEAPLLSWVPVRHADFIHRPTPGDLAVGWNAAAFSASVVNEGRLGSLFFKRLPQQLLPPALPAAIPLSTVWEPEDIELRYAGFTEKTLSFALAGINLETAKIGLHWQEPGGIWEPLAAGATEQANGRFTVSFRHPAPHAAGLYRLQLTVRPEEGDTLAAMLTFDQNRMVEAGLAAIAANDNEPEPEKTLVPWAAPSAQVEELLSLIPVQPGFRFTGLPEMPELNPDGLYELSSDKQSLIASHTGTVYPNEQYAETGELAVTNGKGETVTIPYYEDASGKRYFITAHLWYLQRRLAISGTETLAASDPLGAARLLYRFAQAYEGYNPTADAKWFNLSISRASGPPYSYFGGLWNRWWVDDLLSLEPLLRAYKIVKGTDAFEQLSDALGEDVEQKLVEGLFRPSIDQVMTHVPRYGNLSDNNWSGLVTAARALDEPDYIHLVVSQVEEFLSGSFLSDGFWHEVSLSYHQDLVSGIAELAESLKGWSDTPGYVSPRTGRHLENLDVARDFPIIGRSLELLDRVTYPDGKQLPLQDAWADRRSLQPQADRSTLLLPAAKIARLSGGEGATQTQIYMNFDPKYGNHYHRDPLNLNLYAQGQELLPDLGYTHTIYHYYANSTIGHNTVVVDGKNMEINDASKQGGNVQAFIPEDGAFGLMRADYASAYSGLQTYSREPWFVPFADGAGGEGYVLDLFRVTGGSRHEYTLQGDANRDAHFETALPLAAYGPYLLPPGTEVVEPIDQTQSGQAEGQYPGYIYVRDVLQAELPGDRYEVTLVTEENESEQAKLRVTGLLEPGSNELYLGRSPSLRATRLNGPDADNNDTAKLYDLPKLVLRREGTNLQSTFATVLEPYRGAAPRIEAIERLQPQQSAEGATAVKIVYDGTTDILLSNPLHPEQPLIVDDIVLRGETGFIRMVDGEVREMRLVGGTLLKKGERELTGQGAITGVIGGTLRQANGDLYDALVTDTAVGEEAVGRYVIVTQSDGSTSGYEIGEVRREQGRTLLVLVEQDPGFEVRVDGSTQQIFYPQRQWNGEPTFRIANAEQAVVHPGDSAGDDLRSVSLGAPRRHLTQGSTVQLSVYGLLADGGAANLTEADIVFASSAPEVLAVDGQGNVTALAEGTAVLSVRVTLGGWTKYAGLMLSSQHEAGSTELLKPPALAVSNEPVFAHETAEIAFADNAVWRAGITGVTVNVRSVSQDVYSVSAGKISFAPGVFAEEGSYWITVRSSGYEHATVGQPIASEVSLGVLTVGSGVLRPTFSSGTTDYTTTVDSAVYGLNVTAAALRADAVLSVGEHVYGNGLSTHVNLHNGWNMLPIRVEAPNGSAKTYTLSILRETGEAATGTVTGTVYDPAGAPVPAAVVRLTGNLSVAASTGADGSFALEHVPEGWQRLTATHPGYARTVSEAVYVSADRHTSVALSFTADLPPVISAITSNGVRNGDPVKATSSENGWMYLVPTGTTATASALEAAAVTVGDAVYGMRAQSFAGLSVLLDTSGMANGNYMLYAVDENDNVSEGTPLLIIPKGLELVDNVDASVSYSGSWTSLSDATSYGGTMTRSLTKGAYADIPFYGTSADLIVILSPNFGQAAVYVDGVYQTSIDYYSPTILRKRVLFSTGMLESGVHIIRLEVLGQRNAEANQNWISLDAVQVTSGAMAAPQLSGVTPGPVTVGEAVYATSSQAGSLYLVPTATAASEAAFLSAVTAGEGKTVAVLRAVAGALDTTGLPTGSYRVYAVSNESGMISASSPLITLDPYVQMIDNDDSAVFYSGSWTTVNDSASYGGTNVRSSSKGAYAEISFEGSSVELIATLSPNFGKGALYVDGVYQETIDYYATSILRKQVVYVSGTLEPGAHILRLEVLGQRNPLSASSAISFDALRVSD